MSSKPQLIVIGGPTAVGKTDATIQLAKALDTVILSCDSRQFYKEMSIGTAKPTVEEMDGVKHYFIDSHSIHDDVYTAGKYENEALTLIDQLFQTNDKLILTGGSGLYLHSIVHGIDHIPSVDQKAKEKIAVLYQSEGIRGLQTLLKEKDPQHFSKVDTNNHVRLIRALEVCLTTGLPYSSFLNEASKKRSFDVQGFILNRDREELYNRINMRVDMMLEAGLEAEAKALYAYKDHPSLATVGYREIFDWMDGKYESLEEAVQYIKQNTRRYAKRQLTWFKKYEDYTWVHPDEFSASLIK